MGSWTFTQPSDKMSQSRLDTQRSGNVAFDKYFKLWAINGAHSRFKPQGCFSDNEDLLGGGASIQFGCRPLLHLQDREGQR